MGAFYETKIYFSGAINYNVALTYDGWNSLPDKDKSAALFVQYFDAIYSAWNKVKSFYTPEEDGVSTMMQYLQKNVPIIESNPAKFSPAYIYRVAFNCLYCICHDIKKEQLRWEMETSNIVSCGDDELDLFDTVVNDTDFSKDSNSEKFWLTIDALGPKAAKVVNHLLNGDRLGKLNKRSANYDIDPLRDIEVKLDEVEDIVEELKVALAAFKSIYY